MPIIKSNITKSLSSLEGKVKHGLEASISARTELLLARVQGAVTGPGRAARSAAATSSFNPNLGIDVPFASLQPNVIGDITGELRGKLQMAVKVKRDTVVGEVGFGKDVKAKAGAKANALAPGKAPTINVVPIPAPRRWPTRKDLANYRSNTRPEEYIADVLLGSKTLVGRNVLRLALYDDIMEGGSEKAIRQNMTNVIKTIGTIP